MRPKFPLFSSPLDLAHLFWKKLLQKDDTVIDATCGNGKDSLAVAQHLLSQGGGHLYCIDIQEKAIENTKKELETSTPAILPSTHFFQQSHATFPPYLGEGSVKLIIYNLGYLPKGDKSLTTLSSSTLHSITEAISLICPGGMISITCYPGHPEGAKEQELIIKNFSSLDPSDWSFSSHLWMNRNASPGLFLLQKIL